MGGGRQGEALPEALAGDARRSYVARAVADGLAGADDGGARSRALDAVAQDHGGCVGSFLDDAAVGALYASAPAAGGGAISLANDASGAADAGPCVVLTKLRPQALHAADLPGLVAVATLPGGAGSPLAVLWHSLRSVYAPMVASGGVKCDERLAELLGELEAGLGTALRRDDGTGAAFGNKAQFPDPNAPDAALAGVLTPADEFRAWAELAGDAAAPAARRDAAKEVLGCFEPLRQPFDDVDSLSEEDLLGLVDSTSDALEMVWGLGKQGYSERRVAHLVVLLGNALRGTLTARLRQADLWGATYKAVEGRLRFCQRLLAKWEDVLETLKLSWNSGDNQLGRRWEGPAPPKDDGLAPAKERLKEVVAMRETHETILKLLSGEESRQLLKDVFVPFAALDPLKVSEYSVPLWRAATEEYNTRMAPVEERLSQNLREVLGTQLIPTLKSAIEKHGDRGAGAMANPHQVMREIARYAELLRRPKVSELLAGDKEALRKLLKNHVENLQSECDGRSVGKGGGDAARNLPEIVDSISWAVQCEEKVRQALDIATRCQFNEAKDDCDGLISTATSLLQDIKRLKTDQFQEWKERNEDRLSDIRLDKSGKIINLDAKDGNIKLHYNDQLVQLLREVRQLRALNFQIPRDIASEVDTARTFYRHGMVLKQVSNFYNDIGKQMMHCQMPMMLTDAQEFERVINNPKDSLGKTITWDNPSALEAYISKLQKVTNRLTDKNRLLRKEHSSIAELVVGLLQIDLVKQRDRWNKGVKEIRDVFKSLEPGGSGKVMYPVSAEDQMKWRRHWDHQIYKALEYQYHRGLECLNDTLPQTSIKLMFKGKKVQFEPPLEELRMRHYHSLKDFLCLPLTQLGVSDLSVQPGFFRHIMAANAPGVASVYAAAEDLFKQLQDEQKKYVEWVALGTVDLDDFAMEHMTEVAHWKTNFEMRWQAAKDAEKIPTDFKKGCFTVDLAPIRTAVDDLLRQLHEVLVTSLKRKTQLLHDEVANFISGSDEVLASVGAATNVEEFGKAAKDAKGIIDKVSHIPELFTKADGMNKMLRQVGGSSGAAAVVDMSGLLNQWDSLYGKLQQLEPHLGEQKKQLKTQTERKVNEFNNKMDSFSARWYELKPKGIPEGDAKLVFVVIQKFKKELEGLQEETEGLLREVEDVGMEPPTFSNVETVGADIESTASSWTRFEEFSVERDELTEKDWISVRSKLFELEDFCTKWADIVKDAKDDVAMLLRNAISEYRKALPYLKFVGGDGFQEQHWAQLFSYLGMPTAGPEKMTRGNLKLSHFLAKVDRLVARADDIKALHAQAQGEVTLREALNQLNMWGFDRKFATKEHKSGEGRTMVLIKDWKDLLTEVSDYQSLVSSLKDSPFFKPFKDDAAVWEDRLGRLLDRLQHLNAIQRRWLYLEPIFSRGALPGEQARFTKINAEFLGVMGDIEIDPLVQSYADRPRLGDVLPDVSKQLEICQRALSDFLEEKRGLFPRFYFIGDDDLLEILGQAKNPEVIQSHLKKLFAGIHTVVFSKGGDQMSITAMRSVVGEEVPLTKPVVVQDAVEVWLQELSVQMKTTLARQLDRSYGDGNVQINFQSDSSQVMCLTEAISFCGRVEAAIPSGRVAAVGAEMKQQLQQYASTDTGGDRVTQLKIQALIMDIIHNIDVTDQLIEARVQNPDDWQWSKQLRYYAPRGGDATQMVRMAEGRFEYTYEYQGNAPKLVYTPLTDKCYLTLTQGMALGYGGNPYGPAGTGKTESVKALGQCFARQVLVFNCDESFDFNAMARIFQGLMKCGAWGCFDEFNRLEEDVLSAVSQQIQQIQAALKERTPQIEFLGHQVAVDPNAGIFVTLNPAGKGYGGRSKLPDNLKQLFRSVAMTLPNNDLIAEVNLVAEGFQDAKELGRKVVSLFQLSRQLLSPQQHYDWGLRALKTVLGIAGKLKAEETAAGSTISESEVLIRAVRITTLPKLTFDDVDRFAALVSDIFPGVKVSDATDAALQGFIMEELKERGFETVPDQVEKIMQLHMACTQRIGVIIVGPSGSGKTSLWRILEGAYKRQGRPVKLHVMNPKAINRQQLLGHMDMDTREWFDGVLSASARAVVKEPIEQHSWIICDGDVDPEWIESLNSVLDDNRVLTLPSGERIQFASNINFIFECDSLRFASPATVSRTGMIFLSEEAVPFELILKTWLNGIEDLSARTRLEGWLNDYFGKALAWILERGTIIETTKQGIISNALSHLRGAATKRDFARGLVFGMGSNLDPEARDELAQEVGRWTNESNLIAFSTSAPPPVRCDDLVQVEQVVQNKAMLAPWLESGEPFIVAGPEGCGKAVLLLDCFSEIKGAAVAVVSCSAQTSSANVVQKLVQVCGNPVTTNRGRVIRPKDSERLVLYLKDVNLPKPDQYATIQLISFLQQLIAYEGFYDESLEFVYLERVQIVCSINPPTTVGRHPLTTRFTAIARVAYIGEAPAEQLREVFVGKLAAVFREYKERYKMASEMAAEAQVKRLADCMLEIWQTVRKEFSVDDHRHYRFTPRSLSQWCLALRRYDLRGANEVIEAMVYEAGRIFRDRLVGDNFGEESPKAGDPCRTFDAMVANAVRSNFHMNVSMTSLYSTWLTAADDPEGAAKTLAPVETEAFQQFVSQKLTMYEREMKELNILLFPEVLERIARFDRALSAPGGSLLLCGRSGVGRRTTVALVAYMHRLKMFSPAMGRGYDIKAFRTDLKKLLQDTGVENKRVLFFLEDNQMEDEAFIEITNSLLASGEVPGLFTNQELESMLSPLRGEMEKSGFEHRNLFDFFTSRVRSNLSIVLSMDPSHERFAFRCESNPALFTRCAIQWMTSWSEDGMKRVPEMLLQEVFSMSEDDYDDNIIDQMFYVHGTCKATPRQYVTFVDQYKRIFKVKRGQQIEQRDHLRGGLSKLAEAASKVDELSKRASEQKTLMAEKQAQADQALVQITASMSRASESKREVEIQQTKIGKEEVDLNMRKRGIEEELSEIQPLIESARKAVGQIKSDNINEIRALRMPPDAIRDVLEGVLRLMGNNDTSWQNMKKFLSSRGVKDEIINFDARKVTGPNRKVVQELINSKASSFEHQNIHRVSVAAAPLAAWVKANVKYSMVLERIAPLENDLADLKQSLEDSKHRLVKCEEELGMLDDQVKKLKNEFAQCTSEAEQLKIGLEKATSQLQAAERLLGKLSGEKDRWQEQVTNLDYELKALPLNSLAAAGFIAYLPNMSERQRLDKLSNWCQYMEMEHFDLKRFLSTESEMLTWKAEGLPADNLSVENGVVILQSVQCPLIIDPSTNASEWLKTHLKKAGGGSDGTGTVATLTTYDPRFVNELTLAVRFGKCLIIEEVDRIEPLLYPLLRRDLMRQGSRWTVMVGDKETDYNESFRLFLVTRNRFPNIPPDAASLLAQINFSVTRGGLEGQLLGLTMQHEQPEIEQQKSSLLQQEEDLKVQLAQLEKTLLQTLATSTGNILENTALIQSLDETKIKSTTISQSLQESRQLQASLDEQREQYRPLAERGSLMFFLIRDLKELNHMYQFSLNGFLALFKQALNALDRAEHSASIEGRIAALISTLLRLVFHTATRSLYKSDRLTFAMHFARNLAPELFDEEGWRFFLGQAVVDKRDSSNRPAWVREEHSKVWSSLSQTFPQLVQSFDLTNASQCNEWMRSPQCEVEFPDPKANGFHKLLLVQAFRPDRLASAMTAFVCTTLGVKSISPPPLSLQRLYEEEVKAEEPLLFITTPGADPSQELEEFADRVVGRTRYHQLAMGQGQADTALRLLKQCAKTGEWLCLKNIHLVVAWLPTLEKELCTLNPHPNFRLFLTSEPHAKFPSSLLEGSLKITFEAPAGIKKNLQRTYEAWTPQYIANGPPVRAQLLFVLAWFHAVVQERRSYVPQGWSKFYEFSFADLRSGADIIDLATRDNARPRWAYLHGLLESAIYGGRVDNTYDVKTLRSYLKLLFADDVLGQGGARQRSLPGTRILLPTNANHADYSALFGSLTDYDAPDLFGLPANIDRATQQTHSANVISSLKAMAASQAATHGFDREVWKQRLAPLLTVWERLSASSGSVLNSSVAPSDLERVKGSPLDSFVGMQRVFARKLMALIERSLGYLVRVLKGTEMLTPAVVATGQALLSNTVPTSWDALWEGPEDPAQYLVAAVGRAVAVDKAWATVMRGGLLSAPVTLSDFYEPEVFLNALRQHSARALGKSMDGLQLVTSWDAGALPDAVTIEGLSLQGARFDGRRLLEVEKDGLSSTALPPARFAWIAKESRYPYAHHIGIPLYVSTDRSQLLAEIQLPLAADDVEERLRWVLAGTAVFVQDS